MPQPILISLDSLTPTTTGATWTLTSLESPTGLSSDMADTFILVPHEKFLRSFLHVGAEEFRLEPLPVENPFFDLKDANAAEERPVVKAFTSAINLCGLTPGLKMQTSVEAGPGKTCRPEGEDDADQQANIKFLEDRRSEKIEGALYYTVNAPTDHLPHLADQVVPIEFKQGKSYLDPFDDRDENGTARSRKKVREQLAHHTETVLVEQHRTFLFFIFVLGWQIRFTRWDQSGVIVTPLVDYYDAWETTCDFLRRIAFLACHNPSGEDVGYDNTAVRIEPGSPRWTLMTNVSEKRPTDVDHEERDLRDDELTDSEDFTFAYIRTRFRNSIQTGPRYALQVPDESGMHTLLVGRPEFTAGGVVGRFTRGYIGYDEKTGQFYWLKDTWRADYKRLAKEGDTLKRLQEAGVKNIPTLVCHGDIDKQVTRTHDFWSAQQAQRMDVLFDAPPPANDASPLRGHHASGLCSPLLRKSADSTACKRKLHEFKASQGVAHNDGDDAMDPDFDSACPLRRHRHYRLCVKEIGRPLESFTSPRQFVRIMHDAGSAHGTAFELANTLHRDISGGNIIIYPRVVVDKISMTRLLLWIGLLIDWELAKRTDALKIWTQPGRTASSGIHHSTRLSQFMSIAMLLESGKASELSDDLEALFYVTLYYLVRYVPSNIRTSEDVFRWLEDFFECYAVKGGTYTCGLAKKNASYKLGGELAIDDDTSLRFKSPLDKLIKILHTSLKNFYQLRRWEKQQHLLKTVDTSLESALAVKRLGPPSPSSSPVSAAASREAHYTVHTYKATTTASDDDVVDVDVDVQGDFIPEPGKKERRFASVFQDHSMFLKVFETCMETRGSLWTKRNKPAADRLLEDFYSTRLLGPKPRRHATAHGFEDGKPPKRRMTDGDIQ
ncbi:uncharacterized protein BXZ73DRAFT_78972 [Epithele typhae]|uniref:uncharacterized protein n=1 Tax=Epithele typhae TaxID=378194 RepID=UPI002007D58B|nr:uncharacterized protein BXZ73DRAFT_78972 [Epithele typhae]KAH9925638.1 hypothetical protein BXZ73DRAFT_78972 [Epithele typhae]